MYVVLGRRGIGYWEEFEVFDTTSVVIPTGGRASLPRLHACLYSIRSQRVKPLEVLVPYIYPRGEKIPSFRQYRGCTFIPHPHGEPDFPPALARNVGIRMARGDLIMTVDADTVLDVRTIKVWQTSLQQTEEFLRSLGVL